MHQQQIELTFKDEETCWITLYVPNDRDDEEYIDEWVYKYFPESVEWDFC